MNPRQYTEPHGLRRQRELLISRMPLAVDAPARTWPLVATIAAIAGAIIYSGALS